MKDPSSSNLLQIAFVCFNFFFLFSFLGVSSVFSQAQKENKNFSDPEKMVRHLYQNVTFPAGKTPDWDYVRTMFLRESVVVMRTGRDQTATLSLDGWILDFVNFINDQNIKKTGFEEEVIKTDTMVFGDIAHVLVLYTSFVPGVSKKPREGVDSFHLIKKEGRWWIVSILNEIPTKNRKKPERLK